MKKNRVNLCCEVISYGRSVQTHLVYTGLFLLKQRGFLKLSCKLVDSGLDMSKPFHLRDAKKSHIKLILNGKWKIYYDLHDSYEIDENVLNGVDVYYKRNYYEKYISQCFPEIKQKIYPFGPNYYVYPDEIDFCNIKRALALRNRKEKFGELLKALNLPSSITNIPKLKELEAPPNLNNSKKIIFMAGAWDPYENKKLTKEKIDERIEINETRASCIRMLKKEFGKDFFGGFTHTEFAKKNYTDCLVPDNTLSRRINYLRLLKKYSICVATEGLHHSIGFKFGEYIATAKAVVAEKMLYSPGKHLRVGKNYLEFDKPDECVEKVYYLYENDDIRLKMMINNAEYYYKFLRPDALIYRTILNALKNTSY